MKLSRSAFRIALLLALPLTGCNSLQTLTITPAGGTQVLTAIGQTAQFRAVGTYQMGSAPSTTGAASVNWTSSAVKVATIDANGLATATGQGVTTITAEANGVMATSNLTVTLNSSTSAQPVLNVIPSSGLAVATHLGDTTQFLAYGNLVGGDPLIDLTKTVTWVSSNSGVATINSAGLATAVGPGSTVITAAVGGRAVTTDFTVSATAVLQPSLAIIPALGLATGTRVGETTQFLAFGTLGGATTLQDLTNKVHWVSSDTNVAIIDQAGLATSVAALDTTATTTITAIVTTNAGSILTQTSSLSVSNILGSVKLPTLAVYKVGQGTGTVTSDLAGINCGPVATCTGNFPLHTVVTLTAVFDSGSSFGGWSSNCTPKLPNTAASPNPVCTVSVENNTPVGAIFNKP